MIPAFQDNLLAPAAFRSDLVRWRQLVTPAWLAALLAQDEVLAAPAGDWRLFEVGMGSDEAFLSGHIPGAGFIATHQLEARPLWNKVSDQALLRQPDGVLASIRTWNEFTGKTSGYAYIQARGDIQGARWGRAGDADNVNSMSAFHHPDGTMKPASEICRLWRQSGIHSGQQTAFYCDTGWRASLAFFYAWLMNWERISVYDGGWHEWSRHPGNPVVCRAALA
ncbi:MAG: rhodanese-like domain-containing protein [Polaromonas sp.]